MTYPQGTFAWAMQMVVEGKRVRRGTDPYWWWESHRKELVRACDECRHDEYCIDLEDLTATDWEICPD